MDEFLKSCKLWTNRKNTNRPFLKVSDFQEAVYYLIKKLKNYSVTKIIKLIKSKNKEYSLWTIEDYNNNIRRMKNWNKYKQIADNNNFWLGMFKNSSEEYVYKWIYEIYIHEYKKSKDNIKNKLNLPNGNLPNDNLPNDNFQNGNFQNGNLPNGKKKRKKTISKTIKKEVWKKCMGNVNEGLCLCCKINKINAINNCSYGHIISEADGGPTTIDNLIPICTPCNLGMQTQNMIDYIKENYPKNLDNILFKNKLIEY